MGNKDGQIGLGKKNMDEEIDKFTLIKGIKESVQAIECGLNCSFALTEGGKMLAWGKNEDSILGIKKKMKRDKVVTIPTEIGYFDKNGIKIVDICCGAKHMIAMDDDANVYTFGSNKFGQCGIGKVKPKFVEIPRRIDIGQNVKIIGWRMGMFHTFVCSNKNEWFAFGSNAFRQCIIRGDEFDERVLAPTPIDTTFLPKKCNLDTLEIACGRETT